MGIIHTSPAASASAIAYTLFGSCHLNGVDPLAWATDAITKLQAGWPRSGLDELLPDAWAKNPRLHAEPIDQAPSLAAAG